MYNKILFSDLNETKRIIRIVYSLYLKYTYTNQGLVSLRVTLGAKI